jgi:hypothetical protein
VTVVSLLARCDLHRGSAAIPPEATPWRPGWSPSVGVDPAPEERSASFDVAEYGVRDDGTRVLLHQERGFTVGVVPRCDPWSGVTAEMIERDVLTTVLPDDDDTGDEHPYEWLADLCRQQGVDATADDLRRVPYHVELTSELRHRLGLGSTTER